MPPSVPSGGAHTARKSTLSPEESATGLRSSMEINQDTVTADASSIESDEMPETDEKDIFYQRSYSGLLLTHVKADNLMDEEAQFALQNYADEHDIDLTKYWVEVEYRVKRLPHAK